MIPQQQRLLGELAAAGQLSEDWRPAFEMVPRHLFAPSVVWIDRDAGRGLVSRDDGEAAWFDAVYEDAPLITQWDDGTSPIDSPNGTPTSSLSQPSIVAGMLEHAHVEAGMKVLEIGTGPGWNAALLAARAGDAHVTTIEVDGAVASCARENMRLAGRAPMVVTGDGAIGYPQGGLYDRVMATCSVYEVPYAWVTQTRPGGLIITPWRTALLNGLLLRLTVGVDGPAHGTFVDTASFMPMRSQRSPDTDVDITGPARTGATSFHPSDPLDGEHAQAVLGMLVASCYQWTEHTRTGFVSRLEDANSGSWASIIVAEDSAGAYQVRQGGPRQLWDELESAYGWWLEAGKPEYTRFGVTIGREGQSIWFDHPDQTIATTALSSCDSPLCSQLGHC